MVGQQILVLLILVRIQVSQPLNNRLAGLLFNGLIQWMRNNGNEVSLVRQGVGENKPQGVVRAATTAAQARMRRAHPESPANLCEFAKCADLGS